MNNDTSGLMNAIAFLVAVPICWLLLRWWFRPRHIDSALEYEGQWYQYSMGNDLYGDASRAFRGIVVTLPKRLPHIYIDGHKADNFRGPRYVFPRNTRLKLEGEFNQYFQVYAEPEYKV